MKYETIAEQVISLSNKDVKLRNKLAKNGELGESYNDEMEKLHNRNTKLLNEIISKIGSPTIDKVG